IANHFHDSSSLLPLGQNQPVSATAIGIVPQTIAQGVKMEPSKVTLVTTAAIRGHIECGIEDSIICGSASTRLVIKSSRLSALSPVATAKSVVCHRGSRSVTTGI